MPASARAATPSSTGTAPAHTSAETPLRRARPCRCPSRPNPVTSVAAGAPTSSIASAAPALRAASHRIDVTEGIGCGDGAPDVRVVHDRREEVDGEQQGEILGNAVDRRVVGRVQAEEEVGILAPVVLSKAAQDLRQVARTQLAGSAGAVGELGEALRLCRHPSVISRSGNSSWSASGDGTGDGTGDATGDGTPRPVCSHRRAVALEGAGSTPPEKLQKADSQVLRRGPVTGVGGRRSAARTGGRP